MPSSLVGQWELRSFSDDKFIANIRVTPEMFTFSGFQMNKASSAEIDFRDGLMGMALVQSEGKSHIAWVSFA